MEQKKSKFAQSIDSLMTKAKEATKNFYLSQNPYDELYGSAHRDSLNDKLYEHGYRIKYNEVQGDWVKYGYQVQSFVHRKPVTRISNRIEDAIEGDRKQMVYFTKSSKDLDKWLEENLGKELGWKKDPVVAEPAITFEPSYTAKKLKALQPNMNMSM